MVIISQKGSRTEFSCVVCRSRHAEIVKDFSFQNGLVVFCISLSKCTLELACQIPQENAFEILIGVVLNVYIIWKELKS